jgi:3-methyladenine DNA glycosylase/8-oxoguanine DNA glycosylase
MCRSLAVHECLVATIIEQKVTSREAHRSYGRLVRAEGEDAPGPGGLKLPPSSERLASLPYFRYHPFGIERRRAELVRAVSQRSAGYERLARTEPDKLEPALRSMPGIGPWSVAHVLQAVLGDPDAVIVGDYHMPHIVAWVLAGEPRGDDERMLELLEPFSGQRGRALRLLVTSGMRPPAFGPRRKLRRIETI